jgi:hypothetical protein
MDGDFGEMIAALQKSGMAARMEEAQREAGLTP